METFGWLFLFYVHICVCVYSYTRKCMCGTLNKDIPTQAESDECSKDFRLVVSFSMVEYAYTRVCVQQEYVDGDSWADQGTK
jgi:hypothetical protein